MPHLILEYTDNIKLENTVKTLFSTLHELLARELPTKIESCKSRALALSHYWLGDGVDEQAFMHLTLKIMAGRSDEKIAHLSAQIIQRLQGEARLSTSLPVQVSIEVLNLSPHYFKNNPSE